MGRAGSAADGREIYVTVRPGLRITDVRVGYVRTHMGAAARRQCPGLGGCGPARVDGDPVP